PPPPPPAPAPSPGPSAAVELDWAPCGEGPGECATLLAPLDYADPDGRQTPVALVRFPADNPSARIGSLVVNPGGPGGSGIDLAASLAPYLPKPLAERFDLVGFDPRGVGASAGIRCDPHRGQGAPLELEARQRWFGELAAACTAAHGDVLAHLTTRNTARDLDRIRAALGEPKLTYLGFSYGTLLGAVYAQLFPGNVRALVLDGADPDIGPRQRLSDQAVAFEVALVRFARACGLEAAVCPIADPGALEVWDRLAARAARSPIPAADPALAGRRLGPAELRNGTISAMYGGALSWPDLAEGLDAAYRSNDASLLLRFAGAVGEPNPDLPYDNLVEANAAVNCADDPLSLGVAEVAALVRQVEAAAPRFALSVVGDLLLCRSWPQPAEARPPLRAAPGAPALVIGNHHDPATPHAWAKTLAEQVNPSRLLSFRGDGHTVVLTGAACIDDKVVAYLTTLTLPAPGTVCPPPGQLGFGVRSARQGGVIVTAVVPDGPAEGRIFEGDVIVAANGAPITAAADMPAPDEGETVVFRLRRHGAVRDVAVTSRRLPWFLPD
ncbi:MAG: alpha/beta fold hydrolase, partial [Acidimicrobiales bacterium]